MNEKKNILLSLLVHCTWLIVSACPLSRFHAWSQSKKMCILSYHSTIALNHLLELKYLKAHSFNNIVADMNGLKGNRIYFITWNVSSMYSVIRARPYSHIQAHCRPLEAFDAYDLKCSIESVSVPVYRHELGNVAM